jgi:hypothetical protein
MEEQTDSQLLKRFASQQDETAFAALVRRHGPMLLFVAAMVCHGELSAVSETSEQCQGSFYATWCSSDQPVLPQPDLRFRPVQVVEDLLQRMEGTLPIALTPRRNRRC